MIKAKGLTLIYQNDAVGVHNLSFKIEPGEVLLLLGPSGAGKSSLFKLLLGTQKPTDGMLELNGHKVTPGKKVNTTKIRRMISPVFQDFKLLYDKTALENVILGLRVIGHLPGKLHEESKNALIEVGLSHKIDTPVKFLSYGERQRVAVARAIARDSRIIIADEPTGNLDVENSQKIINLLIGLSREDRIVVIATHERNLVSELTQPNLRAIYLDKGKLIKESVVTS